MLGYVGKKADGSYAPFFWSSSILPQDVEISDDVFLIQREVAEAYKAAATNPAKPTGGSLVTPVSGEPPIPLGSDEATQPAIPPPSEGGAPPPTSVPRLVWSGDVPHQKWMNFYTKVLSKFAATPGLRLTLRVEVAPMDELHPVPKTPS